MARDTRGRFASKPWSDLSPKTRSEKQRHGIGPREHAAGVSVHSLRRLEKEVEKYYGLDPAEVRQELMQYDLIRVKDALQMQRELTKLYHEGRMVEARRLWEQRDQTLPEWMFYYHGAFS